jgi:hypothetical protein
VIEEFERAAKEIQLNPARIPVWQPIIAKYPPTLIGECEKAIKWSVAMAREWLLRGMLQGKENADAIADNILNELASHALTLAHARHLSAEKCRSLGLVITSLEDCQDLQEAVLSVHHVMIHTLASTAAFKIIENHNGVAFIQSQQQVLVQAPVQQRQQPVPSPPTDPASGDPTVVDPGIP